MKKIFKMMALLLCLTATAGMIGCSKDDSSSSVTENGGGNSGGGSGGSGGSSQNTSLAGTKWVCNKTYYHSDFTSVASHELNFTSNTNVSFHYHLTDGEYTDDYTYNYPYTYNNGSGKINSVSFRVEGNTLYWDCYDDLEFTKK